MKTLATATCILLFCASFANAEDATAQPEFRHPVIKKHGGIVVLPKAAYQPKKNSKVIIDITSDSKSGSVFKCFDRAALILNQYTEAGACMDNGFKMTIVLH